MGTALSKVNNRLTFDFDNYVLEREELAQDLRCIAADASSHRQVHASWTILQGVSGVTAGVAGGLAIAVGAAPVTFGLSLPAATAVAAAIIAKSVTAASLVSSAASCLHSNVMDKDIAKRLQNLRHLIESIDHKDKEINLYFKENQQNKETMKSMDNKEEKTTNESEKSSREDTKPTASLSHESEAKANQTQLNEKAESHDGDESKKSVKLSSSIETCKTDGAINACHYLLQVWDEWDLASKESKTINGFDLGLAMMRSTGLVMGTHSIIQGTRDVMQPQDLETALIETASILDKESAAIRMLDLRYLSCIPSERKLPRGRLLLVDGGGGQVKMQVTYQNPLGVVETLQSDSTNAIRFPEGATDVKVTFVDRMGKTVNRVHRTDSKQPWVKDEKGQHVIEECTIGKTDGVDAVFVVKGGPTHAYIHKAWDFGRASYGKQPRDWEWWENAEQESKSLAPPLEQRKLSRETSIHEQSCGILLCLSPQDIQFSAAA